MSKSKSLKRRLNKPFFGMQYYRIHAWVIKPDLVDLHQEWLKDSSKACLVQYKGVCLRVEVYEERYGQYVSPDGELKPSWPWKIQRNKKKRYIAGTCSTYYRKLHQALKDLEDYRAGRRFDGLDEAIEFGRIGQLMRNYPEDNGFYDKANFQESTPKPENKFKEFFYKNWEPKTILPYNGTYVAPTTTKPV